MGRSAMDHITRTPKQLGAILRRRRKDVGLSQDALASRIHSRQATVSALENATTDPRLETVFEALAALDLELVVRQRTKGSAKEIEALF